MPDKKLSIKEILSEAQQEETAENSIKAIELYSSVIKRDALNIYAYDRLMKIFRQLKEYKKELAIINDGIKAYEQFYASPLKATPKKVSEISKKINKAFGLTDKKGNSTYNPEPLARWKKRKINVEKKVK